MFERQRSLNDRERQPGPVVCWISRDLRAEDHWDLALAQQDALEHKQPLLVVFCLQSAYLGALPRAFSFMLTGLSETKASLAEKNLPLMILVGLSTWLMLVFQPDGSIGLYTLPHVMLATFAAVVAAMSLGTVDPLRLRTPKPERAATPDRAAGDPVTVTE